MIGVVVDCRQIGRHIEQLRAQPGAIPGIVGLAGSQKAIGSEQVAGHAGGVGDKIAPHGQRVTRLSDTVGVQESGDDGPYLLRGLHQSAHGAVGNVEAVILEGDALVAAVEVIGQGEVIAQGSHGRIILVPRPADGVQVGVLRGPRGVRPAVVGTDRQPVEGDDGVAAHDHQVADGGTLLEALLN